MFYDNPKVEQLSRKVFIYRNFVDEETCSQIEEQMKPWESYVKEAFYADHLIDWYHGKISPRITQLYDVWCKMNELLLPEYCMHPQMALLTTQPGDEMFIHSDSPGEEMAEDLTAEDRWNTCCVLHYGAIVYFGDFEGGEVFYPHVRNDGTWVGDNIPLKEGNELRVKPNRGDLIIHGAHNDYAHGVHKITSGTRYAYSNFVLPVEKNPGTFPIYGTPENKARWEKSVDEWMTPIDFSWKPSEDLAKKLKEEGKESDYGQRRVAALPPSTLTPSEFLKQQSN